jgi:hypothetical protein
LQHGPLQTLLLRPRQIHSIYFAKQILPGTFEYSLNHLIDHELDLSRFDERFKNDVTGATAYDPRILFKIVLYAYSRGISPAGR